MHTISTLALWSHLRAYWQACDQHHPELAEASAASICDLLRPPLLAMAHQSARQLASTALAEADDLLSIMQIEILAELPRLQRATITNPAAYLLTAARHALCDEMRRLIPRRAEASLYAPRGQRSDGSDGYTLADVLAAPRPAQMARPDDLLTSEDLANLLARLRPCEQAAVAGEYQFSNWQPRAGQRVCAYSRANLYRAMGSLRRMAGTPRRHGLVAARA